MYDIVTLAAVITDNYDPRGRRCRSRRDDTRARCIAARRTIRRVASRNTSVSSAGGGSSPGLRMRGLSGSDRRALGDRTTSVGVTKGALLVATTTSFGMRSIIRDDDTVRGLACRRDNCITSDRVDGQRHSDHNFIRKSGGIILAACCQRTRVAMHVPERGIGGFLGRIRRRITFLGRRRFSTRSIALSVCHRRLTDGLGDSVTGSLDRRQLGDGGSGSRADGISAVATACTTQRRRRCTRLRRVGVASEIGCDAVGLAFARPSVDCGRAARGVSLLVRTRHPDFDTRIDRTFGRN